MPQSTFSSINSIIERDKVDTPYKYSLLRAVIESCQEFPQFAKQGEGEFAGRVVLPVGLLVFKWLIYYYPFFEGEFVVLKIGERPGHRELAFRRRFEELTAFSGDILEMLMSATWQMMAMLNILAAVCGACVIYHTENEDNGALRMSVLPVSQWGMFLGKFIVAAAALSTMVAVETTSLGFCAEFLSASWELEPLRLLKIAAFQIAVRRRDSSLRRAAGV